jgi:hypothetical protein
MPISGGVVEGVLQLAILVLAFLLFRNGLRHVSFVGLLAAVLSFLVGALVLAVQWHTRAHHQPFVLAEFFLLMSAIGAFQIGVAVQGLVEGEICAVADAASGIAPTSLYLLLLAPDADPISRSDQPLRFMFEIFSRLSLGLLLVFFLSVLSLPRLFAA